MAEISDVFFVDGVRTPFGRAGEKGMYWNTRADDLAVKATMVEPVDVGHRGELDVVEAAPRSLPVDQLPLVEPVEALGQGIIEAVAAAADGGDDGVGGEPLGVTHAEILHAPVGVMDQL